jgi:mannose-6-phosphate isomerase-like protein (cupin superfamily)
MMPLPSKHSVYESASYETNPPISLLGSSLLVRANEGRMLHAFGHAVVVLLDGRQTGEKFTAFLNISPPGGGAGAALHEREDEWFYIVEGQVSFLINDTWTDVFPGTCIYSSRGSVHAFKNNTDQPIRGCSSISLPRDLNDSSPK